LTVTGEEKVWLELYKSALMIAQKEPEMFWNRFNIFLGLSLGLLAVFTYFLSLTPTFSLRIGLTAMAFLGFLVCLVWFFVLGRTWGFQRYWIDRTREIERKIKTIKVDLFSACPLFPAKKVKFYEKYGISPLGLIVPIVFSVVWIILIFFVWFW